MLNEFLQTVFFNLVNILLSVLIRDGASYKDCIDDTMPLQSYFSMTGNHRLDQLLKD